MNSHRYEAEIRKHLKKINDLVGANIDSPTLKRLEEVAEGLPRGNRHTLSIELGTLSDYAAAISFLEESEEATVIQEMRSMLARYFPETYSPTKILSPFEFDNAQICTMFVAALRNSMAKRDEFLESYR